MKWGLAGLHFLMGHALQRQTPQQKKDVYPEPRGPETTKVCRSRWWPPSTVTGDAANGQVTGHKSGREKLMVVSKLSPWISSFSSTPSVLLAVTKSRAAWGVSGQKRMKVRVSQICV